MENLYDLGKVRVVGASNFSIKKLGDLLAIAHVPPAVNQAECHPAWQQTKLHAFCQEKGIYLSAYRPLGSPGTKSINVLTNPALNLVLTNPALNPVAERLGKSPAQIALRWGIKMGHSVLPKSTNEARIKENIDLFDWSVPEGMLPMFSEIKQVRLVAGEFAVHPNGVYKSLEELWGE